MKIKTKYLEQLTEGNDVRELGIEYVESSEWEEKDNIHQTKFVVIKKGKKYYAFDVTREGNKDDYTYYFNYEFSAGPASSIEVVEVEPIEGEYRMWQVVLY